MISKQDLLKLLKKEFSTTSRMLRAFPENERDFRPHERSSNVMTLTSTFVFEMYLIAAYALGDAIDRSKFKTYRPESVKVVTEDFENESSRVLSRLENVTETDLQKTVEFGGAKFPADEFILMMMHDQIHHRGQLSVYVRMAGGKVPSVYGPSADDKSTNL
jgi:uncharacterized damage-inducible protein DinB